MLRGVLRAGLVLAVLLPGSLAAQEPPPRPLLGSPLADPTDCDRTPEAIRRLYVECNPPARRSAEPSPGGRQDRGRRDGRCADLLMRSQLGEQLAEADQAYLRGRCGVRN